MVCIVLTKHSTSTLDYLCCRSLIIFNHPLPGVYRLSSMNLPVTLALFLGFLGLLLFFLYRYLTRNYGFWESQGIPTVKPHLFLGSNLELFSKPPGQVEDERFKKYGRLFGTYEFFVRALNIADPDLVHQVLVKDFHIFTNRRELKTGIPEMDCMMTATRDETWKRIRSVVSPSFTSGKLRKMNCHFVDAAEGLIGNFKAAVQADQPIDAKTYFSAFSMDVFGLCVLGIRVDSLKNPDHPFVVNTRKIFAKDLSKIMVFLLFQSNHLAKFFFKYGLQKIGAQYFIDVCEEIIRKRKEVDHTSGNKPVDFIQLLLDAREGKDNDKEDKEDSGLGHFYREDESSKLRPAWNITKTLSDVEIQAQVTQFFSVGHETISTALAMAAMELALNSDVQEKAFLEVQDTYRANGEFNYDVVSKMPYLEAVVCETLRLHTIAAKAERQASEDYVLGNTGITIPKGALVMILIHSIHHDPEWYPDPYKFNPDRFLPENRSLLTPYTYLPFGDGPRNCVAMRFVLLEIKLCIAMVLRKIKFVATDETHGVEFCNSLGVLSPKSVKMRVESRE